MVFALVHRYKKCPVATLEGQYTLFVVRRIKGSRSGLGPRSILPKSVRQRITDPVVDAPEDLCVDLAYPAEFAAYQQIAVAVKILGLLEIGEDIIFLVDKGEVECARP